MHTLRSTKVFKDSTLTVIAVESVDIQHGETHSFSHVFGQIEALAVVVCGPDGTTAYDIEAKPTDLDQLKRDVPGLAVTIDASGNASIFGASRRT